MNIVQTDPKACGMTSAFLLCSVEENVDSSPVTKLHLCTSGGCVSHPRARVPGLCVSFSRVEWFQYEEAADDYVAA